MYLMAKISRISEYSSFYPSGVIFKPQDGLLTMFFNKYIHLFLGILFALSLRPALAAGDPATEMPIAAHLPDGVDYYEAPGAAHTKILRQDGATPRAVVDWETFNIGQNAHVIFDQQAGSHSVTVNRVTGAQSNPAQILGKLTANGTVLILDPNGVIFGAQSVIDVGGIVASTGQLASPADFLAGGRYMVLNNTDTKSHDATVQNLSTNFTVRNAGLAGLVAPIAANNGTISARLGSIVLASGRQATLDFYGDRLVNITVDTELTQPLPANRSQIENTGTLIADGGRVVLTARAASAVVDKAINTSGIISAQKASVQNGKIILSPASGAEEIHNNSILVGTAAKIQDALDMTADNSTNIHLQPGIYTENIRISKPVSITGVTGRVVLDAEDDTPAIHITAPNVTLSNLTVLGGLNNILAEGANGISLFFTTLRDSVSDAVHLINTSVYHFSDTYIQNAGGMDIVQESTPVTPPPAAPAPATQPDNNRIFSNPAAASFQTNTVDIPMLTTAESLAQIAPAGGDRTCDNGTTGCAE